MYLVIDALDEISQNKRRTLMDTLFRLQTETSSVRLIITSRPLQDVITKFKDAPTLEIHASQEDVDTFVSTGLEGFRAPMNAEYREKVRQCITKTASGL